MAKIRYSLIALLCALFVSLVALAACSPSEPAYEPVTSGTATTDLSSKVSDKVEEYRLPTEPYYVLVVGNDSREGTVQPVSSSRADATMILRIDPVSYQVSILSLPRDTVLTYNGAKMKLNRPYEAGGIEAQMQAIKDFTGIDISYYLDIGLAKYVDFYNAIGGVDADVPIALGHQDIVTGDYIWLEAGPQHLNGNQALVLSRVRKAFSYGDPCRQYSTRHMMENTISLCANSPELAVANFDIMLGHFDTDWPKEMLWLQIKDFCDHADQLHFVEGNGIYEGEFNESINDWACYEDSETWSAILKVFTEGGDPTTVLPLAPMDPA